MNLTPNYPSSRRFCRHTWLFIILLLWVGMFAFCGAPLWGQDVPVLKPPKFLEQLPPQLKNRDMVQLDLTVLCQSYPTYCRGIEIKNPDQVYLVMQNNTKILYDDGKLKTFDEQLESPDLQDMLAQVYPFHELPKEFRPDYDPGRIRVAAFFHAIFGGSPGEVSAHLTSASFVGQAFQFNAANQADQALAEVSRKLTALIGSQPHLRSYLFPLGGGFIWRPIAGTKRLSPHSWGTAIDLNPKYGAYWRWEKNLPGTAILQKQRAYPQEIVKIFEDAGFIWGGKWSHFDLMHFEYRPEIILKAKVMGKASPPVANQKSP
jgi:hypothetical protein